MLKLISKKLSYGLLVLAGVVLAVFFLFMALPGDTESFLAGQRSDVQTIETIKKELGLDKPKSAQLFLYINDLSPISIQEQTESNQQKYHSLHMISIGKNEVVVKWPYLRTSYQNKKPVTQVLLQALPNTLVLAFAAIIFAVLIGITLGVISSLYQHGLADNIILIISTAGISAPSFFVAIIFQWLFAFVWQHFTGLNMTGSLFMTDIYGQQHLVLGNLILPAITLGIRPIAIITQLTRSSMLDVLHADYVRTATAKGLSAYTVITKHALRNALTPVVTAVTGWFAEMLAGAFFIEMIFGWNGIGKVTVDALGKNDFPVVMGAVLFSSCIFIVLNIVADVLYGLADPRVAKQ